MSNAVVGGTDDWDTTEVEVSPTKDYIPVPQKDNHCAPCAPGFSREWESDEIQPLCAMHPILHTDYAPFHGHTCPSAKMSVSDETTGCLALHHLTREERRDVKRVGNAVDALVPCTLDHAL